MPVLSGHLFKINLRNYHSAGVPSLGFYNFIFLLQCLYPRAPQFIYAAQPRWIINRGREQKDDERHKRSIIRTQMHTHTFSGGGDGGVVLLSLFRRFCLSTGLLKSDIPCLSAPRAYMPAPWRHKHKFSHTGLRRRVCLTHILLIVCTHACLLTVCLLCPSSIPQRHFSWASRDRWGGRVL